MATDIDTARPDTAMPVAVNGAAPAQTTAGPAPVGPVPVGPAPVGPASAGPSAGAALAAFRAGRGAAERTTDLLAFAIATEHGLPSTPDAVERARREADAALGEYSLRYVHNNVEQIRQEAVTAHLARFRPAPGFPRLVAANLVALVAAAALATWLWTRPDVRAALSGLLAGLVGG